MASFDIPDSARAVRSRLRRHLKEQGFGRLQNSVWITPHPLTAAKSALAGSEVDPSMLLLMDGRPCGGETDEEIAAGAWRFHEINRLYDAHQLVLDDQPKGSVRTEAEAEALRRWASKERSAWAKAFARDPLLPNPLLPDDYLGKRAWKRRRAALRKAGRQILPFTPPNTKRRK